MDKPVDICGVRGKCCESCLCPLSRVMTGSAVRIKQIAAAPDVARRLREIGFCEERPIKLLSRHTNLICLVCNARLGISGRVAENILVEMLPSGHAV